MQRSYIKKFILIAAAVAVLVAFFCLASCGGGVIKRRVRWYVAYCEGYASHDVTAMGGAGYNLSYRGNDYVAAACFEFIGDAENYAAGMSDRGIECRVITCERLNFSLTTYNASQSSELYGTILDDLNEACRSAGEAAARAEGGGGVAAAREAVADVNRGLTALLYGAPGCFTAPLARLCFLAADCAYSDVLFIREVRFLQLAIADVLMNITLS